MISKLASWRNLAFVAAIAAVGVIVGMDRPAAVALADGGGNVTLTTQLRPLPGSTLTAFGGAEYQVRNGRTTFSVVAVKLPYPVNTLVNIVLVPAAGGEGATFATTTFKHGILVVQYTANVPVMAVGDQIQVIDPTNSSILLQGTLQP